MYSYIKPQLCRHLFYVFVFVFIVKTVPPPSLQSPSDRSVKEKQPTPRTSSPVSQKPPVIPAGSSTVTQDRTNAAEPPLVDENTSKVLAPEIQKNKPTKGTTSESKDSEVRPVLNFSGFLLYSILLKSTLIFILSCEDGQFLNTFTHNLTAKAAKLRQIRHLLI